MLAQRLLLVEDSDPDAELVVELLADEHADVDVRRATSLRQALQLIGERAVARIVDLTSEGASLHTVAAVLNSEGVLNPLGRRWHSRSVARCLQDVPAAGVA